eukprot:6608985-Prymnesium_polylepis.1
MDRCWCAVEAAIAGMGEEYVPFTPVVRRLDPTLLTARRQRTGTIIGEDTSPHPHNPSRPL